MSNDRLSGVTVTALMGLGEIYRAQSRNQDAEVALREAYSVRSRIRNYQSITTHWTGCGMYPVLSRGMKRR